MTTGTPASETPAPAMSVSDSSGAPSGPITTGKRDMKLPSTKLAVNSAAIGAQKRSDRGRMADGSLARLGEGVEAGGLRYIIAVTTQARPNKTAAATKLARKPRNVANAPPM